jgi:hypothetical protein
VVGSLDHSTKLLAGFAYKWGAGLLLFLSQGFTEETYSIGGLPSGIAETLP